MRRATAGPAERGLPGVHSRVPGLMFRSTVCATVPSRDQTARTATE